ncbi:MAG: transglutaminase domain-containing protein [Candidatus Competibacteraceae bacterium]|nr:transglutaminase domain-containing protein [Candidatus Competibacteraceae bacterium]
MTNTTPRLLKQTEIWIDAPVKQTATQQTIQVATSLPHTLIEDPIGNQILHLAIPVLPPNSSKILTVTADLRLSDHPNPAFQTPVERFTAPEPGIESNHPLIQTRAQTLQGPDPLTTSRRIYQWVADNMEYIGYVQEQRGALHALQHRKGDCTEYADLFTALARANGIPARTLSGCVYEENAVLKVRDYHNWAKFYHEGQWYVADPQKRTFMSNPSAYLALRISTTGNPEPWGNAHQFAYVTRGIRVKMH